MWFPSQSVWFPNQPCWFPNQPCWFPNHGRFPIQPFWLPIFPPTGPDAPTECLAAGSRSAFVTEPCRNQQHNVQALLLDRSSLRSFVRSFAFKEHSKEVLRAFPTLEYVDAGMFSHPFRALGKALATDPAGTV